MIGVDATGTVKLSPGLQGVGLTSGNYVATIGNGTQLNNAT